MWLGSHMPSLSHHRLIIATTISYLCSNPNPKVCPYFYLITLKYLKNTETNIYNVIIITGDVKIKESGLDLFYFYFYFYFYLFFYFLFLEQLGLGLIGYTVTSVTTWWRSHKTDHETWEKEVEGSRTSDVIQYGQHMLASWQTHRY